MSDSPAIWSAFISSAVVPVVIISACGLLCLAFYNRLAAIIVRMRTLQKERFLEYKELFKMEAQKKSPLLTKEEERYLHFLETQAAMVLKKAKKMRNCITCLVSAIASLLLCSLSIGLSLYSGFFDWAVLFFFILGLLLMLWGLYFAIVEVRIALRPIQEESAFLQKLIKTQSTLNPFSQSKDLD